MKRVKVQHIETRKAARPLCKLEIVKPYSNQNCLSAPQRHALKRLAPQAVFLHKTPMQVRMPPCATCGIWLQHSLQFFQLAFDFYNSSIRWQNSNALNRSTILFHLPMLLPCEATIACSLPTFLLVAVITNCFSIGMMLS